MFKMVNFIHFVLLYIRSLEVEFSKLTFYLPAVWNPNQKRYLGVLFMRDGRTENDRGFVLSNEKIVILRQKFVHVSNKDGYFKLFWLLLVSFLKCHACNYNQVI